MNVKHSDNSGSYFSASSDACPDNGQHQPFSLSLPLPNEGGKPAEPESRGAKKTSRFRMLYDWLGAVLVLALVALFASEAGRSAFWVCVSFVGGSLLILALVFAVREGLGRFRARQILVFLWLVFVWGCWFGIGFVFGFSRVEIDVHGDLQKIETSNFYCPTSIVCDGQVITTFDAPKRYSFKIRHYKENRLRVEVLHPEGWSPCPVKGSSTYIWIEFPTVTLYIDNRRNGAAELRCGQLAFRIKADSGFIRTIPAPLRPHETPLTIDGQAIGELDTRYYLVAGSGGRNYRLQERIYEDGESRLAREMAIIGQQRQGDRILREPRLAHLELFGPDRRLHTLPKPIDYFLTPAPQKITIKTLFGGPRTEIRWELLEES